MQWRNFIDMDTHTAEIKIKFKYDYLGWLKQQRLIQRLLAFCYGSLVKSIYMF